ALRRALESHGVRTWVDSREQTAGDPLTVDVRAAIEGARAYVVLFTQKALNSRWVAKELHLARDVESRRTGYKVIPIVAAPLEPSSLEFIFGPAAERDRRVGRSPRSARRRHQQRAPAVPRGRVQDGQGVPRSLHAGRLRRPPCAPISRRPPFRAARSEDLRHLQVE